ASNVAEAGQDIYLGYKGDGKTLAINPIRDTLFMGNDKLYHQVGGLFTTASAVMIPIGQTQSVTKGLAEFAIGEVGGFVGGQAGYHGTKLLGGSEADAERATFVGSIIGGFAASSAASKFSLNKLTTKKMPDQAPPYNKEQVLKNLEESRLARESSNFSKHLEVEKAVHSRLEHKAQRWLDYQNRQGKWSYQRWSKQYDVNMKNNTFGLERERLYREVLGGESRVLKTAFTLRQIDRMDGNVLQQLKTGKVSLTKQAKIDIQKDIYLKNQGYDVSYVLEKGASKPFLQALDDYDINYFIGSIID
ncbi:hypothetical protein ACVRZH_10000, partial [Streptococcus fryi]